MKKSIVLIIIASVLILSCNNKSKTNKSSLEKIVLQQEWFPFSGFSGEVVAMYETDSINGIDLKIEAGSDNIDPIKLVLSKNVDFGVISADRILTANAKGADLVVIGVINSISPTCFISIKDSINSPKDFEGKKVGILTGTNTEMVYKTLLKVSNVNEDKITEIEIPFDLGTFISGAYDVRPAFIYDEPVSLDLQNIDYTILEPSKFGVSYIGTVYFTRKDVIEQKPELVQKFINSVADGWKISFNKPETAINYLKQYDSGIDKKRELLSLKKGISYFKGEKNKVLYASKETWERMAGYLIELGIIKDFNFNEQVDNSFINKYHNK